MTNAGKAAATRFARLLCSVKGLRVMAPDPSGLFHLNGDLVLSGESALVLYLEAIQPEPSFFPNGNIGMPLALTQWRSTLISEKTSGDQLDAQLALIARQLRDGRNYLQGRHVGLADIQAATWVLERHHTISDNALASISMWLERMRVIDSAAPTRAWPTVQTLPAELQTQRKNGRTLIYSLLD